MQLEEDYYSEGLCLWSRLITKLWEHQSNAVSICFVSEWNVASFSKATTQTASVWKQNDQENIPT
jgi:hypothetical protein